MNIAEARAHLGITAATSPADAKAAYRARAKLFHPDRAGADPAMRSTAERAMSELNEAWSTYQAAISNRGSATRVERPEAAEPQSNLRPPAAFECTVCGAAPATQIRLSQATGMVIAWK